MRTSHYPNLSVLRAQLLATAKHTTRLAPRPSLESAPQKFIVPTYVRLRLVDTGVALDCTVARKLDMGDGREWDVTPVDPAQGDYTLYLTLAELKHAVTYERVEHAQEGTHAVWGFAYTLERLW
jgi:hypothetical protein